MTNPITIRESFEKLHDWARAHALAIFLRPPASPTAISTFIKKSGLHLPDDLTQLLRMADGEERKSAGLIGNWRLMPITEIQGSWGMLSKLAEKGAFIGLEPQSSPYIRDHWWYKGWIPVVSSDTGDFFCVDSDPPDPERAGQVLLFLKDRYERPLVAGSLGAWFDRITRDLENELYTYHPESGFNGEAFMWSSLEQKHLFDDFNGKLVA